MQRKLLVYSIWINSIHSSCQKRIDLLIVMPTLKGLLRIWKAIFFIIGVTINGNVFFFKNCSWINRICINIIIIIIFFFFLGGKITTCVNNWSYLVSLSPFKCDDKNRGRMDVVEESVLFSFAKVEIQSNSEIVLDCLRGKFQKTRDLNEI